MDLTFAQEKGRVPVTVFHINGSLDSASYKDLEEKTGAAISSGTKYILLDLTSVPYVSSAGLRAVNHIFNMLDGDAHSQAEIKQGLASGKFKSSKLKLLNPTPRVLEVLQLGGFDMFLEIHRNLQNAIASF